MPKAKEQQSSHKQILKSTGIIGGSKIFTIIIGIARTKIVAVLLGPAGVGIIGLYTSTLQMVSSVSGLGLGFSAVRDVAEASGTKNQESISKTILVLRRWVWFTGIMGMVITIVFAKPLSILTFGDDSYTWGIALLSATILLSSLSKGQIAVLQGLRRIDQMAKAGILGTLMAFFIAVPLYYFYGNDGIVPALLLTAVSTLFFSWWFARKIKIDKFSISLKETFGSGLGMVKLGMFTVVAGFVTTATMYGVRIFISNKLGIDSVGIFQAAWVISTMYIGLVLDAMSADYFPRLSQVNKDNKALKRLVNEQTEIGLIIALPLIVGMLVFLPFIIRLFYSAKFEAAIPLLDWQLLGVFLRVIGWPMGFVILAKAKGNIFIFTQILWNTIFLAFIFFGWRYFQLEMTGIAFFVAYLVGVIANLIILRKIIDFGWSSKNIKLISITLAMVIIAFLMGRLIPEPFNYIFGSVLLLMSLIYSYYELNKIVNVKEFVLKLIKKK